MATASEAPAESPASYQTISAIYQAPSHASFTHTQKIPTPPTASPADKAKYLGALRKAAAEMQEQINTELTARMEEDRAREAGNGKGSVDEAKEEDNYGEEVVEED